MLLLLLALSLPPAAPFAPWLQFGGPSRDFTVPSSPTPSELSIVWRQSLASGTSAIVSDGNLLITMAMRLKAGSKTEGEELTAARDLNTGKMIWEKSYPINRLKGQESFSGDPIRPQSTPALHQGCLCTLGYTGILTGWEVGTGNIL